MSTNYYLDSPNNEAGHIGKWAGDYYYFIATAPDGVDSLADWKAMLDGHRIFAEDGREYTPAEILNDLHPQAAPGIRMPRTDEGEWIEDGVLFVRHDFC